MIDNNHKTSSASGNQKAHYGRHRRRHSFTEQNYASSIGEPETSITSTSKLELSDRVFLLNELNKYTAEALNNLAEEVKVQSGNNLQRYDLIFAILKTAASKGATVIGNGVLEILKEGYGFLRSDTLNYMPGSLDIYITTNIIKQFGLRTGDRVQGVMRAPKKGERYFALCNVEQINDIPANQHKVHRRFFDDLTPLYAEKRIVLENPAQGGKDISSRVIDIVTPLGKGQRTLVVAPPRTGKTVLMQNIADAITNNYPEIILMVLLIGERPEEVTDMARSVRGEVISSTFDEPSTRHVQLAELVIEKAKRMVEEGKDVVILLDSITRLARAYNDIMPSSGKILTGGVASNALQEPKRLFGAARNTEEGGSLTIIGTALIDSGSKMDTVIFEEFKGTGNAEIMLERKISDKRIFPAIDISQSGTRKEEILIPKPEFNKILILRRILSTLSPTDAIEFLLDKLRGSSSNRDFFDQMNSNNTANGKKPVSLLMPQQGNFY